MKIRKIVVNFLLTMRIVKTDGSKFENGCPVLTGLNKKNPLSYLFIVIFSLPVGIVAAVRDIKEFWVEIFK